MIANLLSVFNRQAQYDRETNAYIRQTLHDMQSANLAGLNSQQLTKEIVMSACQRYGVTTVPRALIELTQALVQDSGLFDISPPAPPLGSPSPTERAYIRQWCANKQAMSRNIRAYYDHVARGLENVVFQLLRSLPTTAFQKKGHDGYEISLYETIDQPSELIERWILEFESLVRDLDHMFGVEAFEKTSQQIDYNLKKASGIDPREDWGAKRRILPSDQFKIKDKEIVRTYLKDTAYETCLLSPTKFVIPERERLKHTQVIGGSGAGKTQLLQNMLVRDLDARLNKKLALIVIDPEEQLTEKLLRHPYFDPQHPSKLYDKLRIVDPTKSDGMPPFNMFDGAGRLNSLSPREQEAITNRAQSLFSYTFNALKETPLTGQQETLLEHLVQMLFYVKGANLDMLVKCLRDENYANKLALHAPQECQEFFNHDYVKAFKNRRAELIARMAGLTKSPSFKGLLQANDKQFDILKSIDAGEIIVLKPDKSGLGTENSRVFVRYFIALAHQAILKRQKEHPVPCYLYIDEAQEYLGDQRLKEFYAEARKRSVGLVIAHHNLGQADSSFIKTVVSSTVIRMVGRCGYEDAQTMSRYMNIEATTLSNLPSRDFTYSTFAIHVTGQMKKGVLVKVPHGTLENSGLLSKPVTKGWKKAPPTPQIQNQQKKLQTPSQTKIKTQAKPQTGFSRFGS